MADLPAIAYGVAALGHSADARKLQLMRLPDLAARSRSRLRFEMLDGSLLFSGGVKKRSVCS